jgi:hypothetical protein
MSVIKIAMRPVDIIKGKSKMTELSNKNVVVNDVKALLKPKYMESI